MNKQEQAYVSALFSLDKDLWYRNKSVHLASKGAMRPWSCRDQIGPLLVLLPDQRQTRDFVADGEMMGLFSQILLLPEVSLSDDDAKLQALRVARGGVLEKFKRSGGVLAATPASLLAPFSLSGDWFRFANGEEIGRDALIGWLARSGYVRNDIVWSPGQYVSRGSIVDLFSPSDSFPLRIEFFDDTADSIRFFLPETQKSLRTLQSCSIQSLRSQSETSLENYFPDNMSVLFFDPKGLDTTAENSTWLWNNLDRSVQNAVPWQKWEDLCKSLGRFYRLRIMPDVHNTVYRMPIRQFPMFRGKLKELELYCAALVSDGYEISVYSESQRNLDWADVNSFKFCRGTLSEGFIDSCAKKAIVTDLELAGISVSRRRLENHAPSDWGAGLIPGQWVVHDDYGVALYLGPQTVSTLEGEQEYLVLQFAEDRRLMIPVMQFWKISSWAPIPGQEPIADSLKSSHWKKSAAKARELAEKAARELVEIYAARELTQGYAFAPGREMMKEIEGSFVYTETADQLRAIEDVTLDMARPVPMDRLIVGDVGFGKTEVALRAAALAVFNGKQVAIMAPTTLLAQQHYETFSLRFANTPVRVEVVSRFISISLQKKIVQDLKDGKVDIIIGTHRLISSDIIFKDLGLMIIDEEHRFGVMHKEHLKKMAPDVDVLMLSATPIPRSLSMSISGLRDMSILQTPPQRRLPVITVVRPWSEELLKNAVLREKNRGGQIFFVHNRIGDIQERATMLKRLFPKLKVAVAHSRTPEGALEKTMMQFSAGDLDILVCTTIVESGLDIPQANTLIVDDAHELGLAQMYQLRGRVGRREEQAYAFLFYPAEAHLSVDASERLEAIAELDELGAGYQLAQRDLQIRGGGDLIGVAQHGNSGKVGYQKYCDMLSEEIARIKGKLRTTAEVQIDFPATIPSDYLPQENLRVTLYRRLLKTQYPQEVTELRKETIDRFGELPPSLKFLLDMAYVRSLASELNITKIVSSRYETIICADTEGAWRELVLQGKWMRRLDGLIGPGGFDGMSSLCEIIERHYSTNLIK